MKLQLRRGKMLPSGPRLMFGFSRCNGAFVFPVVFVPGSITGALPQELIYRRVDIIAVEQRIGEII